MSRQVIETFMVERSNHQLYINEYLQIIYNNRVILGKRPANDRRHWKAMNKQT